MNTYYQTPLLHALTTSSLDMDNLAHSNMGYFRPSTPSPALHKHLWVEHSQAQPLVETDLMIPRVKMKQNVVSLAKSPTFVHGRTEELSSQSLSLHTWEDSELPQLNLGRWWWKWESLGAKVWLNDESKTANWTWRV